MGVWGKWRTAMARLQELLVLLYLVQLPVGRAPLVARGAGLRTRDR